MALNEFRAQDDYSRNPADEPFWRRAYGLFFPDLLTMSPCIPNLAAQKLGVDRVLVLANGRTVAIDEKKRPKTYRNAKDEPEILLEFLSNDRTNAPGWIEKALAVDYVACAFMDTQTVYLLPWDALRRVWLGNRNGWKRVYGTVQAQNDGYTTHSVPVPAPELYRAIGAACCVSSLQIVK